ncbi:alpha/beta hydrolase [Qipengyuania sp. ASV99]|uniref:alpha/beta hydrolase n=1 Tax=Qipengyuania sp. ASV99 TaxID=3399681 RepID=UPI003A4C77B7
MIAVPILAQQDNRPSRQCVQEIRALCGSDRAQIRSCLAQRSSELSDECSAQLQQRIQQRLQQQGRGEAPRGGGVRPAQSVPADRTVIYGDHQRQQIDIYAPGRAADPAPLVLFIHGGGWSFGNHKSTVQSKPAHFTSAGYYFASTGYRLLPDAPVETQAADVGAAIAALRTDAAEIGFDPDRIVLMGHSAGAHLAALVASDPQYAGEAFGAIAGVVLLDGAGYNVSAQMQGGDNELPQIYARAFGTDPARQAALSPITHVGGSDAPHWLALYVAERQGSKAQSEALAAALAAAGASAEALAITGTDHGRMNRELGTAAGAEQTRAVDAFLARIF